MKRIASAVLLLLLAGCATGSVRQRFPCSDDVVAQWQIPLGWLDHELTPAEARGEVATANVAKDSVETRWENLSDRWREGDRYWLYRRPGDDTIIALGEQEGVVLMRGCDQLGFVTTRIAAETPSGR